MAGTIEFSNWMFKSDVHEAWHRDTGEVIRYIATQYGEGYVWVAEPFPAPQPAANAFLVIGPVRGLNVSPHLTDCGYSFARRLMPT